LREKQGHASVRRNGRFKEVALTTSRLVLLAGVWFITLGTRAQDLRLELTGGRWGFSTETRGSSFEQAEGYAGVSLPWDCDFADNWWFHWRADVTAGWLGSHGENAFVGSLGPTLVMHHLNWPVSLEGGLSPTYVSRYRFDPTNLGSNLQFTSHAQLNWDIGEHLQLSYRFQHMSDGGLFHPNPGLNLHMFGIAFRF